jgi:hypothetical protein
MGMKKLLLATLGLISPLVFACGAQVTPNYEGEALATVTGTVVGESASDVRKVDAAIVWFHTEFGTHSLTDKGEFAVASRIPVAAHFPAAFTLDVKKPPPPEAEWQVAEVRSSSDGSSSSDDNDLRPAGIWTGVLAAIAPTTDEHDVHAADIVGVDLDHVVVYFADDNLTGASQFMVPTTKGYHIANVAFKSSNCVSTDLGFCIKVTRQGAFPDEDGQSYDDWTLAECQTRHPTYSTCTINAGDDPQLAAESAACEARIKAVLGDGGPELICTGARQPNPSDLATPVTITLGKPIWAVVVTEAFPSSTL